MPTPTPTPIPIPIPIEETKDRAIELLQNGRAHAIVPRATYRLQFHKEFTFADAIQQVPYLHALGISHVYASPVLEARPGSVHGYDIIHHGRINPELGGEEGFRSFVRELKAHGMGLVLDFVPNHMGVGSHTPWWRDILKNGRCSPYAHYFDIDWEPLKPELKGKLLLPVLGAAYGEELENGKLKLAVAEDGEFEVRYYDHSFPVALDTLPRFLDVPGTPRALLDQLMALPQHSCTAPADIDRRQRAVTSAGEELRRWLKTDEGGQIARQVIQQVNGDPGDPASFDRLHVLLEHQPYRLAYWRVSGEEINYRRFFDVNDLVGLAQEFPDVFAATHSRLREMIALGEVDGVRIDHCDGLLNPLQYLVRLQMLAIAADIYGPKPQGEVGDNGVELAVQQALTEQQYSNATTPLYCVVEKILEPGEQLPREWPVQGTSGYDFLNLVNGIFVDSANEKRFTAIYERMTGVSASLQEFVYASKKLVMNQALSSEVNVLTHMLAAIVADDRYARDFTQKVLREAIREVIACFPVYRTYVDERGEYTARDREFVERAVRHAIRMNPGVSRSAFEYLRSVLLLERPRHMRSPEMIETDYRRKLRFTLKFQQLSGPVMAKGLEDTAFYIYNRFISLNEVGGSPEAFGVSVEEFHRGNDERARDWPACMLATSTHDTKRSEDVRARLNVLSEMPTPWSTRVLRWRRLNRAAKIVLADGRVVPDGNEEYLLYQTIIGSLPWGFEEEREGYIRRLQQYMNKAAHEAKVNLSWINDDPEYVQALENFVARIFEPGRRGVPNPFVRDLLAFTPEIVFHGAINSLAQTVLKLTAPGVPDVYQGMALWDYSLVDPDNRRAVDYGLRRRMMDALREREPSPQLCEALMNDLRSGAAKMWTLMRGLQLRREMEALFKTGAYVALPAAGDRSHHLVAYSRVDENSAVMVAAPRLSYTLLRGRAAAPLGEVWGNTSIAEPVAGGVWENVFSGEQVRSADGRIAAREILRHFPIALLRRVG